MVMTLAHWCVILLGTSIIDYSDVGLEIFIQAFGSKSSSFEWGPVGFQLKSMFCLMYCMLLEMTWAWY